MRSFAVSIAGSQQIARLPAEVKNRVDTTVDKGFQILVGEPQRSRHHLLTPQHLGSCGDRHYQKYTHIIRSRGDPKCNSVRFLNLAVVV